MESPLQVLLEVSVRETAAWLRRHDYCVKNEAEICRILFHHLARHARKASVPLSAICGEIKLLRPDLRTLFRISGSIDFGIRSKSGSPEFDLLFEVKIWNRPTHLKGVGTPNSCTSRRKNCIADALRLLQLKAEKRCSEAAIVIFEQGSTHLRRCVPKELASQSVEFHEKWFDTARKSLGVRKEHVGVIWMATKK